MKTIFFLLLLFFISVSSFRLRFYKQDYDSYVLSVLWPNGYCKINDCKGEDTKLEKNIMTIRGFWPSLKNGEYAKYCNPQETVIDLGTTLFLRMRNLWPSFTGNNEAFWDNEYNTYGACMVEEYKWKGYDDYFNFVLDLFEEKYKYLMIKIFGNTERSFTVSFEDMEKFIQEIIPNASFQMKCNLGFIYELDFHLKKGDFSPAVDYRYPTSCFGGILIFK